MAQPRPYPKFTYEDYLLLPEDKRYELIEGELLMVPLPGVWHQKVIGNLYFQLKRLVEEKALGELFISPLDIVLSQFDIVQPDIVFIAKEHVDIITEENIQGPPDIAVEVLSSDEQRDKVIKKKLYAKFGIKEYWLVNPKNEQVEVMVLDEQGYQSVIKYSKKEVLKSATFPDLQVDLSKVFKKGY